MRTHELAIRNAADAFANALATCAQMTPREQAEAAHSATSSHTVNELEDIIREQRGLDLLPPTDRHS